MKARFLTAERMLSIEASSVVDGDVDIDGNLILATRGGSTINAGKVKGDKGDPGNNVDAKAYSDNGDAATLASAKTYSDSQLVTAKSYSDGLMQGTALGASVDLNTITTPGIYHQSLTANAVSGTNYPPQQLVAGLLEVRSNGGNMVWQRYTPYGTYGYRIFQRDYYNGAWYGWYEVAPANAMVRVGRNLRNTNTTTTASEYNVCTVSLPNPINGDTYAVRAYGKFVPDTAGSYTALRLRHGLNANIGGTQIALEYIDHRIAGRIVSGSIEAEFTYTGTSGAANYNVVFTAMVGGGGTCYCSAQAGAEAKLFVDRIL